MKASLLLMLAAAVLTRGDRDGPPPSAAVRTVAVDGTALRVTFGDGRVVSGAALEGATLTLTLAEDARPQRIRLDRIVPDPADPGLLLYRMTVLPDRAGEAEHDLCEPDKEGQRWGFPLAGRWDADGRRVSRTGLTLACAAGGAIGKCVRWGYKPWQRTAAGVDLAPYHAACVNMVRANYCGRGTTRDGMTIDYWDTAGVNVPDDAGAARLGLRFEAAWTPTGALCVGHPRVPEKISLETLEKSCPRLRMRLGQQNCIAQRAVKGDHGPGLIFNRSY